jgi:hypothetical protein
MCCSLFLAYAVLVSRHRSTCGAAAQLRRIPAVCGRCLVKVFMSKIPYYYTSRVSLEGRRKCDQTNCYTRRGVRTGSGRKERQHTFTDNSRTSQSEEQQDSCGRETALKNPLTKTSQAYTANGTSEHVNSIESPKDQNVDRSRGRAGAVDAVRGSRRSCSAPLARSRRGERCA